MRLINQLHADISLVHNNVSHGTWIGTCRILKHGGNAVQCIKLLTTCGDVDGNFPIESSAPFPQSKQAAVLVSVGGPQTKVVVIRRLHISLCYLDFIRQRVKVS